ncbi:VENN motif-containing pre-toxin protein [Pantoea ananatis]|nr:VENN motif-containing pre-toxin protein [Pantoea ananatis]
MISCASLGGQFAGNMANTMLAGAGGKGHAEGTTQSAVANGTIVVRDQANQKQDTATLSRDTAHANDSISPIFNKEKEQQRLQTAQMIGEIGSQVADIARTQGEIYALKKAQEVKGPPPEGASEKARNAYIESLKATPEYKKAIADSDSGTGSSLQQGIQAATAAVQGLAGGDFKAALAGASAPYLAELIHKNTTTTGPDGKPVVNTAANLMAHAVVGAVIAQAQGNSALSGASGAALGEFIAQEMYPGIARTDLSEEQKQTISALGTLAAGLAGGLANGSASGAIAGAQAGKNAVENNSLADIAQAQSEGKTLEQKANEQVEAENDRYKKANCGGMSAEACSVKMYQERREALKETVSLGADFVPIVGDIKSFAEAQSAADYLAAVIGIIPGAGDAAGKIIKAAEAALKNGDVAEASKLINKASEEIQAVKPLDVGSYKELKDRSVVGDGLEHDHIPSFAAIRQAKENELGRKLTPTEEKNLYNNATAIEVPKDVHQAGRTYGGKNTPSQIKQDAIDLCGAECRDTEVHRKNMLDRGYDPKIVDDAIMEIKKRNSQTGVTK